MDIAEATWQAETLIQAHLGTGWKLGWMRARKVFGSCHYNVKTIYLSRVLVELNSEAQVLDTILHEIAHALTPGDGHGNDWRAMCRKLGATPKRVGRGTVPPKRWIAQCACGQVYTRDRLPNRKPDGSPRRTYCGRCYVKGADNVPLRYLRNTAA